MGENESLVFCKILLLEDFNKICRCCLSVNTLGSIFEIMYEGTSLDKLFHTLFGTQLDREDGLPEKICETCVGKLICCHIFKKRYETSETALRNIIPIKIEADSDTNEPEDSIEELVETQPNEKIVPDCQEIQTSNKAKENLEPKVNLPKQPNSKESEPCKKAEEAPNVNIPKQPLLKLKCSCGEIFMSTLEFRKHRDLTNHKVPRTHPCRICGKLFTKYSLWAHSRIHDAVKRYSCNFCAKRFACSGNLRRHLMQHTGERPHLCEFCGKSFIQLDCLEAHRRSHTGEKPYVCSYCGKSFRDKLTCNAHIRSHNRLKSSRKPTQKNPPKKTFSCVECGMSCFSHAGYKLHLYKKHGLVQEITPNDKHHCKICGKLYASKYTLSIHMSTHKDEKQYLCNVCGKTCFTQGALRSHSITHLSEKSFACEFCGKRFARHQSLRTHRFGHTGEKPYACSLCPKKFRQSTHLSTHLKVHTGERPYDCKFCNKSFSHKYTLDVHLRIHTGEKPYKCEICTGMFHDSGTLKKHKQQKHQLI